MVDSDAETPKADRKAASCEKLNAWQGSSKRKNAQAKECESSKSNDCFQVA